LMQRPGPLGLAILLALGLTACISPSGETTTYTSYRLTCCTATDIDTAWRPGTTVDLHLIPTTSQVTTVNPTHRVGITAVLSGPYANAERLKQGGAAPNNVGGSPLMFDDRTPPSLDTAITFALPSSLPAGLYNLDVNTTFGDGSSADGGSIVQVGL
jgi:hypothetical protein